ncbi:DUF674 family protein [Senna tora]|uniref:DUF674 family protein n=1 Tax=Senna tora TaxID=362788 RepID=A0A834TN46_9FABA|nr:DUF674 family protein [Senna tora]
MDSTVTPKQISLTLMVDRGRNRVLFAEAGKDFADVLLSFLTLPLGTIARLVSKGSNLKAVRFGCISSLYESVGNLDRKYFCTNTCKEMLLMTRNTMEAHCGNLKINIDDTVPTKYFICPKLNVESATIVILDDLSVIIDNSFASLDLLRSWGIKDAPKELTVNITQNEVLDLLKCALLSKASLTDLFLNKKKQYSVNNEVEDSYCLMNSEAVKDTKVKLKVKVTVKKSNGKVMYAKVENDFVDLLFSFLTLPVGTLEHILGGDSCLGWLSKLYTSVVDLNAKFFDSMDLKEMIINPEESMDLKQMLINPEVALHFKVTSKFLKVRKVTHPKYCCRTKSDRNGTSSSLTSAFKQYGCATSSSNDCKVRSRVKLVDHPKKFDEVGAFVKGVSMFMVTDDLVVKPFSLSSIVSYLNESNVDFDDLEERIIYVSVKEVMAILKASLNSSSALTTVLSPLFTSTKRIKVEK